MEHYIPLIQELSNDKSIPKYATNLVYLTSANNPKEIEHKIIYSILNKKPKHADIYWFIHVNTLDDPFLAKHCYRNLNVKDIGCYRNANTRIHTDTIVIKLKNSRWKYNTYRQ